MTTPKKTRAPWTEERKAKSAATKAAKAAKNLELYGTKMAPESKEKLLASREEKSTERRNNSKAHAYLPELQQWVLALKLAKDCPEVFDALVAAYPDRDVRWDYYEQKILFSFSTNSLRARYGILAEQMFRRLFVCHHQGGYARREEKGVPSVWHISEKALEAWVIKASNSKFSVSAAVKVLMNFEPLTRAATEYKEVENEYGFLELKGMKKKVMTREQRLEILKTRETLQQKVKAANLEQMKAWTNKELS